MSYRSSRVLRDRVAAKTKSPRMATTATLGRNGLVLDGVQFPYYVGQDVEVTRLGRSFFGVGVTIFAEAFHTPPALPRGTSLTIIDECGV